MFLFAPDRKAERPASHLENFKGVLHVDGYAGFERLAANGDVVLAACWAHTRRKFYEVAEATGSPIAAETLSRIGEVYAVEARVRGQSPARRLAERRSFSRPIVEALRDWLEAQLSRIPGRGALAEAIRYALSRWQGLTRFLHDGRIELDTNPVERAIRPVALGRKNHLFAGSDEGASYCSSRHVLISQRDFSGDSQTAAGVATAERWLRAERSRAPTRHGGLSRARPCTAGSRKALVRRSSDARLTY